MIQISVPTPEISEAVQNYLFSIGYQWADLTRYAKHTEYKYLHLNESKITYSDDVNYIILVGLEKIPPIQKVGNYSIVYYEDHVDIKGYELSYEILKKLKIMYDHRVTKINGEKVTVSDSGFSIGELNFDNDMIEQLFKGIKNND